MQILRKPSTWRELQTYVAEILKDCGFETATEKRLTTVRGTVAVDVYATKSDGFKTTIICECKNWNSRVPQTVAHSFRTVVGDVGAHQGFIISKKGFQKGSYQVVAQSNILLLSWEEFNELLLVEWLNSVIDRNFKIGSELMSFGSYLIANGKQIMPDLYERHEDEFLAYRNAYSDKVFLTFRDHYLTLVEKKLSLSEVNKQVNDFNKNAIGVVHTYKEYFDGLYGACQNSIKAVEAIFQNQVSWDSIRLKIDL